jgi:hypothetical protein
LDTEVDINRAWETEKENIKISAKDRLGYCELKKHEPWLGKRCSELLDKRIQAELQWVEDPREINRDNLNNIRPEVSRHFRKKGGIFERQN